MITRDSPLIRKELDLRVDSKTQWAKVEALFWSARDANVLAKYEKAEVITINKPILVDTKYSFMYVGEEQEVLDKLREIPVFKASRKVTVNRLYKLMLQAKAYASQSFPLDVSADYKLTAKYCNGGVVKYGFDELYALQNRIDVTDDMRKEAWELTLVDEVMES